MDTTMFYFLISLLGASAVYVGLLYKNKKKVEIFKIVQALVYEAELKLGNGTGELKYDFVVKRIHSILPPYIKVFVSEQLLDLWIEVAVDELQEVLDAQIKKEEESHSK